MFTVDVKQQHNNNNKNRGLNTEVFPYTLCISKAGPKWIFFAIFTEERKFCDFLFISLENEASKTRINTQR